MTKSSPPKTQTDRPPNIILLTVDCWRGDHIGLLGDPAIHTPNIDKFAAKGTWFSNHYTCGGWTKIAMTALMSSTYSSQYGFSLGKFAEDRPSLAKTLQAADYKTVGITSNPVCGSAQGFDLGFDHFSDIRPRIETTIADRLFAIRGSRFLLRKKLLRKLLFSIGLHPSPPRPACNAQEVIDEGISWLQQRSDKPLFLWLHFMDLHWPYHSKEREQTTDEKDAVWMDRVLWQNQRRQKGRFDPGQDRSERWKQLYKEELSQMDAYFGRLFNALYDMPDWHNTHVVLTSDHGEEFFEHGTWAHSWNQLHKEGAHVPLIVLKAKEGQRQTAGSAVSQLDIAPTILDLAGVPAPEGMLGQSLCGMLTGSDVEQADHQARPVLSEMHGHRESTKYRLSIVHDGYKYIFDGDRDCCHLFDLSNDPDERTDIYSKDDEVSRRFDVLRLAHVVTGVINILKSDDAVVGEDILYDLDADPKVIERLRALGYLD